MSKVAITLLALCLSTAALSQSMQIGDRWYAGGNLIFNSNRTFDSFGGSPLVGYKFTKAFSGGVRLTYIYTKDKINNIKVNAYGGGPFLQYDFLLPVLDLPVFAYGEYEMLTYDLKFPAGFESPPNENFNSMLLGGGVAQRAGNIVLSFMVLYNVIYTDGDLVQPYNSPLVFRGGISAGF